MLKKIIKNRSFFTRCFVFFFKSVLGAAVLGVTVPIILIGPLSRLNPPTTSIQMQRRISALLSWAANQNDQNYHKNYQWVDLSEISPHLVKAVIASEDATFYSHFGVDLVQAEKAYEEGVNGGRRRGASTITMQLCKNLYLWEGFTLYDTALRKGMEVYLALWMELLLPKHRILELYLNVIEWGPGTFGAEAGALRYYRIHAKNLNEWQAARMAAVLPAPLHRVPSVRVPRRLEPIAPIAPIAPIDTLADSGAAPMQLAPLADSGVAR